MIKHIMFAILVTGFSISSMANLYAPTLRDVVVIQDPAEADDSNHGFAHRFQHRIIDVQLDMARDPSCYSILVSENGTIHCLSADKQTATAVGTVGEKIDHDNYLFSVFRVDWFSNVTIVEIDEDNKPPGFAVQVIQ